MSFERRLIAQEVASAFKAGLTSAAIPEGIERFYADPLGFVMHVFDWDGDPALHMVKLPDPWNLLYSARYGPDAWACQFLDDLGAKARERNFDGKNAVEAIRMAVASGHGIGKSALVAWLTIWIMATRPHARGTITAATSVQLESRTWPEIAKWLKRARPEVREMFEITTGRGAMRMRHKAHPASWFCTAQTCAIENSESFAGQHAANSTSFYIFDEASGVPDAIHEVSEGGLTDGEPMKFCFGNPTKNTGWFKELFGKQRHRWDVRQIDSRTVQITNKTQIAQWIEDKDIDSDWVKVRVRGMFPALSTLQFISIPDVDAALGRHLRPEQYNFAPKVLTLDNSWEGDDEGVIGLRQGLRFDVLRTFAKNDNDIEIANMLAQLEDEHEADAVFIDGGFGTGVVSAGRSMGRPHWQLVWFSGKSPDEGCINMRAFMWKSARDWLKAGGAIPDDQVLYHDLIGPELVGRPDGKIQLEAKKDTKSRGLPSPNRADALVLSFAFPVQKKMRDRTEAKRRLDYDPYSRDALRLGHDPFANRARR
jgi:hypothetical protein